MYRSHNRKYDTDYDPINQDRWRKPDTSKDIGRKAIIAQKLNDYMKGCGELKKLIDELEARARIIDKAGQMKRRKLNKPGLSAEEKQEIEARVDALRQEAESKAVTPERREELKQQIAQLRAVLSPKAGGLMQYDQDLSKQEMKELEKTISKLGIVPSIGKVIDRGQTGKDRTR